MENDKKEKWVPTLTQEQIIFEEIAKKKKSIQTEAIVLALFLSPILIGYLILMAIIPAPFTGSSGGKSILLGVFISFLFLMVFRRFRKSISQIYVSKEEVLKIETLKNLKGQDYEKYIKSKKLQRIVYYMFIVLVISFFIDYLPLFLTLLFLFFVACVVSYLNRF